MDNEKCEEQRNKWLNMSIKNIWISPSGINKALYYFLKNTCFVVSGLKHAIYQYPPLMLGPWSVIQMYEMCNFAADLCLIFCCHQYWLFQESVIWTAHEALWTQTTSWLVWNLEVGHDGVVFVENQRLCPCGSAFLRLKSMCFVFDRPVWKLKEADCMQLRSSLCCVVCLLTGFKVSYNYIFFSNKMLYCVKL